jgi:hypothetical protein
MDLGRQALLLQAGGGASVGPRGLGDLEEGSIKFPCWVRGQARSAGVIQAGRSGVSPPERGPRSAAARGAKLRHGCRRRRAPGSRLPRLPRGMSAWRGRAAAGARGLCLQCPPHGEGAKGPVGGAGMPPRSSFVAIITAGRGQNGLRGWPRQGSSGARLGGPAGQGTYVTARRHAGGPARASPAGAPAAAPHKPPSPAAARARPGPAPPPTSSPG